MRSVTFSFILFGLVGFISCTNTNQQIEYKQIIISAESASEYTPNVMSVSSAKLNALGDEGWDLVTAYPIIETSFPNFGNEEYVTGLRTNTRTREIVYVFKRYKQNKK